MSADQSEPGSVVQAAEKCGTYYGYQLHRKLDEAPCEACRSANATYMRERRAQPECRTRDLIDRKARRRAHQELAKRYPREYRRLFAGELNRLLAAAGLGGDAE